MKKTERIISIIMLFVISMSNVATPVAYAAELGKFHFKLGDTASPSNTLMPLPKFTVDKGSVLGASTSLLTVGTQQSLDLQNGNTGSADKRLPVRVQQLAKKVYRPDEEVTVAVTNPDNEPITTTVQDAKGQSVGVPVNQTTDGTTTDVQLQPSNEIKPGKYQVTITDEEGNSTKQDFSWGVLAMNFDKSMYHPGETGNIAFAVLDDNGNMVCDAAITLQINNQAQGINDTVSTMAEGDKKIIINHQCSEHDFSLQPDYQAQYQFAKPGTYNMSLTAVTSSGSHTITDSIQVTNAIPFDVQRVSATRIYPPNTYPMTFNITAHQDFSGTITETVPQDFVITPATESAQITNAPVNSYSDMETVYVASTDPSSNLEQIIASQSAGLVMPFHGNYPITQGFGAQMTDPTLQAFYTQYGLAGHDGVDFGVPMDTPLYAADAGTVIWSGPGDYGVTIIIQHSWGESYYGHLSTTAVKLGDVVTKGELIGYSGESGEATGPHLHFGIKPKNADVTNGYYGKVDPLPYLPYGHNAQATTSLSGTSVSLAHSATTVLGTSTDAVSPTALPTPELSPSATVQPTSAVSVSPTALPTPEFSPSATVQPTSAASSSATPEMSPTGQASTPQTTTTLQPAQTPSNFNVLDKQILLNEQLINNSQTEKVKVISWQVALKKGETTTLGYDYQTPQVSPQFYLLGPMQFYQKGSNKVVFAEQRQWQLAADAVGNEWFQDTTGRKWNGYSWQYRKKIDINKSLNQVVYAPIVTFMDGGGDSTNAASGDTKLLTNTGNTGGFYSAEANGTGGTIAYDTTNKETGPGSWKFTMGTAGVDTVNANKILDDHGSRISTYFRFNSLPSANSNFIMVENNAGTQMFALRITSGGVLQLVAGTGAGTQIGSGSTLSAGTWYRISLAYTISGLTTYTINEYLNGIQDISVNNSTSLGNTGSNELALGWGTSGITSGVILNMDDIYVDNSADLTDTGDIHVTAKRPKSNGAANNFNTSGTPSGNLTCTAGTHCQYVSERPLDINALLTIGTDATLEEFTVEGASSGDVDVSAATIVSTESWIYANGSGACGGTAPTDNASIINNGTSSIINLSTTNTIFTHIIDTNSYPSGNTAVGMETCAAGTAVTNNLREAGMQIAYIPSGETVPSYTNVPVLVTFSGDTDISSHAQSNCTDIAFTDSTGGNLLPFQIEDLNTGTDCASGNLTAWVQVPTLSETSDSIIYMYFGNPAATSKANPSGVWDTNYKGVWHFGVPPAGTVNLTDSTSNGNNGTNTSSTTTTGEIFGGEAFSGAQSVSAGTGTSPSPAGLVEWTVELWYKDLGTVGSNDLSFFDKSTSGTGGYGIHVDESPCIAAPFSAKVIKVTRLSDPNNEGDICVGTLPVDNSWHSLAIVYSYAGVYAYLNGAINGPDDTIATDTFAANNAQATLFARDSGGGGDFLTGDEDEIRVSSISRSPGLITTEYNNENAPTSFYTTSLETKINAPTLDQLMRHGEWFDSTGTIQPFTF